MCVRYFENIWELNIFVLNVIEVSLSKDKINKWNTYILVFFFNVLLCTGEPSVFKIKVKEAGKSTGNDSSVLYVDLT